MRLFRLPSCVFALAVMAAVTTSFAQTGNQQNAPAPTAGQAPTNPIQEATQSTSLTQQNQQQQQQEQADAAKGKPATFDIGAAGAGQQDQELGEVRLMTRHTEVNSGSPQRPITRSDSLARTTARAALLERDLPRLSR